MSSLKYHQRATLEPVYRRIEILEQFTLSLHRAYEELNKQFERSHATLRLHAPEKAPPFHLVLRVWRPSDSDLGLKPYFAYAFFNKESFTLDDLDKIRRLLYSQTDEPNVAFQAFLDEWQRQRYRPQAVDDAIRWLTSPKDHKSASVEEFHHWLLMLYSRTQVQGGIQGTLLEHFAAKRHTIPALYVKTINEESSNAEGLPKLSLVPLGESHGFSGSVVDQLPLEGGLGAASSSATRFFLDILDTWFRYGPCDRQERGRSDRSGLHMLWIPVFDFYSNHERPAGMFQGWIFKFLGPPQEAVALSREDLENLQTYAGNCRVALPLLSDRLYEQAMREVGAQELVKDDPVLTVCENLNLLEGWTATVSDANWLGGDPGHVARSGPGGSIELSLRITRFDNPALWGESDRPAELAPTLRLAPIDQRDYVPPSGTEETQKYQDRVAARIRDVYRQFRLTAKRIQEARRADLAALESARERSFSHTFKSIHSSLDNYLRAFVAVPSADRRSRYLSLLGITSSYLAFVFSWRQYIGPYLAIDLNDDNPLWLPFGDFLEASLLSILAVYYTNSDRSEKLSELLGHMRLVNDRFLGSAGGLAEQDFEIFLGEPSARREWLASLNPPANPTLSVTIKEPLLIRAPRTKAGFYTLLLAFHEILYNAFSHRRRPYHQLVATSFPDSDLVVLSDRPEVDPDFLRLLPSRDYLCQTDARNRFGLRTIESCFVNNGMKYKVANSEEYGFVRAIQGGFSKHLFKIPGESTP